MSEFGETHLTLFLPVFLAALVVSGVIVLTRSAHIHRTAKGHADLEIQSVHQQPTPRVGGLAVAAGLFVASCLLYEVYGNLLSLVLVAAIPIFCAGLLEDIGSYSSPRTRLYVAILSSLTMVVFTGQTLNSGLAPGLDQLLQVFAVGALFTVLATVAVCHSFNLVDGMNGLAISVASIAALALAAIAYSVGDFQVAAMSGAIASAALGVFFLNFPYGRVFLGDSGAYLLGFSVAWTGVLLLSRNPDVSSWAVLLTIFWPFIDTTAAVQRRVLKRVPISKADRLHFHHVVMRGLEASPQLGVSKRIANPLTTFILLPFVAIPAGLGVLTAQDNRLALLCLLLCVCGYFAIKSAVIRHFREVSRSATLRYVFDGWKDEAVDSFG
ncbi:glycosyltransferase [Shimia sp. FJ5]|nr:glycosyltransferase [Shimia sp. FJ5]MDV4146551.1 glycosyltransferase [Shimia sp. FJ5]